VLPVFFCVALCIEVNSGAGAGILEVPQLLSRFAFPYREVPCLLMVPLDRRTAITSALFRADR